MRRRSDAPSLLEPTGFTTPSPWLGRGPFGAAFSLARPRSGDVPSALETSGDAVAAFVFRFLLARVRAGVVGVAPALATGPRGTTAARHGETLAPLRLRAPHKTSRRQPADTRRAPALLGFDVHSHAFILAPWRASVSLAGSVRFCSAL
jgi:hypothetical protein